MEREIMVIEKVTEEDMYFGIMGPGSASSEAPVRVSTSPL